MGQRLRLKANFVIPSNWTTEEKAILLGLKKYGVIVADNSGGFFSISIAPDDRWSANCFDHLAIISIDNFEVIQTTGPTEGPRSPGAPTVDAGPDQVIGIDDIATLNATSGSILGVRWEAQRHTAFFSASRLKSRSIKCAG